MGVCVLIGLPSYLLGQIITKLDWKSYFRIQQTCRDLKLLVQTERSIKICGRKDCVLIWEEDGDGNGKLRVALYRWSFPLNIESLYGIRYRWLHLPPRVADFGQFCAAIKKYRITSQSVRMLGSEMQYTKEETATVLKLLNPLIIRLNSIGSDRFEALLQVRRLGQVTVCLDPEVTLSAVKMLGSRISGVSLIVTGKTNSMTLGGYCSLIKGTLQFLRSAPVSNFSLQTEWHGIFPPFEELMEMFVDFSPSEIGRTEEQGSPEVHEHLVKCLVGPREANCKVVIEYDQAPNGGPLSKIEVKYEHFPTV